MDLDESCGKKIKYNTDIIIFNEGDPPDYLYLVLSGKIVLKKKVTNRTERLLHIVEAGEYFGEMSLITDRKRTATAKTISETEVMQIKKDELQRLFKSDPEFGIKMMHQMSERIEKTSEELIYCELELALSLRKPTRFTDSFDEKIIFMVSGSFSIENKEAVLKATNSINWPDDVDVIASLFKPGNAGDTIVFVVAAYSLKILFDTLSCFEELVRWEYAPALPTDTLTTCD